MNKTRITLATLASLPLFALAACGDEPELPPAGDLDAPIEEPRADGGAAGRDADAPVDDGGAPGDPDAGPPPAFKIRGTIINAVNPGLVIQQGGADDLTVAQGDMTFEFATSVASGAPYAVTIKTLPSQQACKVTGGAGTVGSADVTDVVVDCANRTSCKAIRADVPGVGTGRYLIDPDGDAEQFAPMVAHCDMTFDDGEGGGAGGWTLVQASGSLGPTNQAEGLVAPGSGTYLEVGVVKALATGATQVHIRTAGAADTASATSTPDAKPIVNLRNGEILNKDEAHNDLFSALWTGPMADARMNAGYCTPFPEAWPNVYHTCGNATGLHLVDKDSSWEFTDGTANIDMEVYVR